VIHAHSFFGIGLEALLNGACLRIPVIGTNHWTVAGFGPHIPMSVDNAAAYVAWFYNRCRYVTAPSRSVFAELGTTRLRRPHAVVSNPIDTGLFRPVREADREALRARFGLMRPTITYAGRLGSEKNIDVLLHAVGGLRDRGVAADFAIADMVRMNRYCVRWRKSCESMDRSGSLARLRRSIWHNCYGSVTLLRS